MVLYTAMMVILFLRHSVAATEHSKGKFPNFNTNFKAYEVTNVSVAGPIDNELNVAFSAYEQKFKLKLHRAIEKAVNVTIVSRYGKRSFGVQPSYYSGKIENSVASFAHGTLEDGVFSGSVYLNGDEVIYAEPLCRFVRRKKCSNINSVVYKRSDVIIDKHLKKAMRYKNTPITAYDIAKLRQLQDRYLSFVV